MGAAAILSGLLTEIMICNLLLVSKVKLSPEDSANGKDGVSDYLIEEEEGLNDHNVVVKCAEIQSAAISEGERYTLCAFFLVVWFWFCGRSKGFKDFCLSSRGKKKISSFVVLRFCFSLSAGATSFLFTEYQYVGIFMVAFAVLIFLFLGFVEGFSTKAQPCAYSKDKYCKPALANAGFSTISFLLGATTSLVSGFLGMKIATYANARTTLEARKGVGKAFIIAFRSGAVMGFLLAANGFLVLYIAINLFKLYYGDDWEGLFESITGYGLGGSSMALFGRVGGGIYTKAADVGADLVGKVERDIPEDDPRSPAVIADNVGDNVGDIAGMGSDLFGSYAESSCAALVVASISSFGVDHDFTAIPVQDVADSCRTGAATNVISGLALGYKSIIIPIFAIAVSIFVSFSLAAMYGIAVAALGMLSTIATGLAIDAYGPISDNAGGIAEMAGMSHRIRERTDALDAAGNTTAAIGKISTDASIKEMIPPGALVMLTPHIVGTFFGVETLSGVLAGSLVSGVQAGASEHAMSLGPKGSDPHKAAVIGDTIGDPLKDTSGPSLNILTKLMAVESLVFAPFFATHGGLLFKIF
ncbi:hypothetical protein BHM03_00046997 [Ensete ventricosum]|nr:hypothetical protein BHM03_00046997 [Ensete ventricosum]